MNQQLLAYLVRWYMSVPTPTGRDDLILLGNLEARRPGTNATLQDISAAVAPLISSVSQAQRITGLVAAIRLGSDDALSYVISGLTDLQSDPRFKLIESAIAFYPHDSAAIPLLQQLIGHTDIPGLDNAVAAALSKIRTKAVLPAVAQLLSSPDAEAQRKAAWFFGLFTMFADATGNMRDSGPAGPLSTPETRAFMPGGNSGMTAAQYAQFWTGWWAQNRAALGFAQ